MQLFKQFFESAYLVIFWVTVEILNIFYFLSREGRRVYLNRVRHLVLFDMPIKKHLEETDSEILDSDA